MDNQPPDSAPMLEPEITIRGKITATSLTVELILDPALACFQGHFPEIAILPGVMQLDWALRFGVQRLGFEPHLSHVKNLRFERVLLAGDKVVLKVQKQADKHFIFEFLRDDKTCSSGQLFLL